MAGPGDYEAVMASQSADITEGVRNILPLMSVHMH